MLFESKKMKEERVRRTLEEERQKEVRQQEIDKKKDRENEEKLQQENTCRRLEQERFERELRDKARFEVERLEKERLERERVERRRIEKEKLDRERLERERLEKERLELENEKQKILEQENRKQERQDKISALKEYVKDHSNDEVYKLTTAFVEKFFVDIMIDPWEYLTIATEISLCGNAPNPFSARYTDYLEFKDAIGESEKIFTWYHMDEIDEFYAENKTSFNIVNYVREIDEYKNLVKMLSAYYDIEEEYHSAITWEFIKRCSTEVIGKQWNNDYDEEITLAQCVHKYCTDDLIDKRSNKTIGCFTHYLMLRNLLVDDLGKSYHKLLAMIDEESKVVEMENFRRKLLSPNTKADVVYTIEAIDLMNGVEFEGFVAEIFNESGYKAQVTRASHDQGIDIIAQNKKTKLGIQCKCYSGNVGNKAVQEVAAALKHYGCDKGLVVTNSYFTESAIELAESNNIILWNRDILKQKIIEIF